MTENQLPLERFLELEATQPNKVYLRQPYNGKWITYTWREVGQEARKLAHAIKAMDLPEKSNIALMSKNCAHWIITDLAIWMSGHISVPLYPTLTTESINQILEHSESKLFFVGKLDDWASQREGLLDVPRIDFPFWPNEGCTSWKEFVGSQTPLEEVHQAAADDIATIIYTSGTTGMPKGVVHTHASVAWPAREALRQVGLDRERFISYLPLSHVAERLLIEMGSIFCAGEVYFAESLDTFKDNLVEASPTVFLAVPRIWTKFQLGVLGKLPAKKLNLLLSIPIVKGLIQKKIKAGLGLTECKIALTGAAPISADLLEFFKKLGIEIMEVYGMTENFCVATFNFPGQIKFGSVGVNWDKGEIKIDDNGEILTKSPATMVGYYKEPGKTAEVITDDGWLRTGDEGKITNSGHLYITGRVKDLFKTSKGKYVAPNPIEKMFAVNEDVEQVCVMGSGMPQPFAVVTLSEIGQAKTREEVQTRLQELLQTINSKVEHFEALSKIVVANDEWTPESGVLTPTMKIKRNEVEKMYSPHVSAWHDTKDTVLFN